MMGLKLIGASLSEPHTRELVVKNIQQLARACIIDCIDYVSGIGNIIQAPGHSVLQAKSSSSWLPKCKVECTPL